MLIKLIHLLFGRQCPSLSPEANLNILIENNRKIRGYNCLILPFLYVDLLITLGQVYIGKQRQMTRNCLIERNLEYNLEGFGLRGDLKFEKSLRSVL